MDVDRNGLEILDRRECLELLQTVQLGRLAVTSSALPSIVPVNFRVADDLIVVRTGRGTKLDAATRNAVVAFEADDIDPTDHTGWSVVITGVARRVSNAAELSALPQPLRWAPGPGGCTIAISTDVVSGRRITPAMAKAIREGTKVLSP